MLREKVSKDMLHCHGSIPLFVGSGDARHNSVFGGKGLNRMATYRICIPMPSTYLPSFRGELIPLFLQTMRPGTALSDNDIKVPACQLCSIYRLKSGQAWKTQSSSKPDIFDEAIQLCPQLLDRVTGKSLDHRFIATSTDCTYR
eukprot:Blabericola_migrator_1__6036@NODE_3040_length_2092_cov_86_142716_g1208_i1_p2_GENE_NODE_3040_length_2092_cov_86_142716_g1208_i1NODE_3040_length_2092_cov_86_142716_g1208_i1_p2_ORF_typecomplete_len144_score10_76_NODE_3040_length_2092_cov_86_142716_g1208_i1490921